MCYQQWDASPTQNQNWEWEPLTSHKLCLQRLRPSQLLHPSYYSYGHRWATGKLREDSGSVCTLTWYWVLSANGEHILPHRVTSFSSFMQDVWALFASVVNCIPSKMSVTSVWGWNEVIGMNFPQLMFIFTLRWVTTDRCFQFITYLYFFQSIPILF